MKGGRIMQLGTPDEIYNRPQNRYVADFIGSPSMNFFEGNLMNAEFSAGALKLPMNDYRFLNGGASNGETTIGIRPEHVVTGELVGRASVQTSVKVNLVEPMGSDTLIYADLAGDQIRIRMDGHSKVRSGDDLPIGIDALRASLFDKKSEMRL